MQEKEEYEIWDLKGEALQRAIDGIKSSEAFGERDIDLDWRVHDFEQEIEQLGLGEVEISYSGFYSQGDGASFTGIVYDKKKFLKAIGFEVPDYLMEPIMDSCEMEIVRTGGSRYVHHYTVEFKYDSWGEKVVLFPKSVELRKEFFLDDLLEKAGLDAKAREWINKMCHKIYSALEKSYEEEFSDSAAEEWADSTGMIFDADGKEI